MGDVRTLRFVLFSLLGATVALSPVVASAEGNFIYRYKQEIVKEVGSGGPVDPGGDPGPTNPGGGDTEEVACGTDTSSLYGCLPGLDEPSATGADPIEITLTGDPTGESDSRPYECMKVTGGYGNYVFMVSPLGDTTWVESVDIVPRSDLDAPAAGNTSWFQYPDYDGDYDIISATSEICVRVIPKPNFSGPVGSIQVGVTVGDYEPSAVEGGKANWTVDPYDAQKEVVFKLKGNFFAVKQSQIGMAFQLERNYGVSRHYGPPLSAYWTTQGSGVLRGTPFYYQCWKYNGGFGSDMMQYMVVKYPFSPPPDWVAWFDVRTPDQLNLPYEELPADHPGSQDASWPMNFPYDQQNIFEPGKEVCLRVAEKPGNKSAEPFNFSMYLMENFPIEGTTTKDQNTLMFEYSAIPVFNDPSDDWVDTGEEEEVPGGCDGPCQ
ncbi:hypothetical protein O9X98_15555 [Agrobacterium salinitolerans]|nr:hypothetical protein [Agrobacterium salinitolerans]